MDNFVEWAQKELDRLEASAGADDDGTQKMINDDIMEIVKVFSSQGHTGFTASYALSIIKRLLDWKPIQPLTGEESEWGTDIDPDQNNRCTAVFREKGDTSKAFYLHGKVFSNDGGKSWYSNHESRIPVTFPFHVPDKPEYIILA